MKNTGIIIFLLLIGFSAFGQDVFQKELYAADIILKYSADIGLSDQQKEDVKSIFNNEVIDFNNLRWELDEEMTTLQKLLSVSSIDEQRAMDQMEKVLQLENKIKKQQLSMLIQLKNKMSVEQQAKLDALMTVNDIRGMNLVTTISRNPRVAIKVERDDAKGQPLYIVHDRDGEHEVESLDFLQPDAIESIQVLKGEAANKAYGNKGKNGVVIIKLKN